MEIINALTLLFALIILAHGVTLLIPYNKNTSEKGTRTFSLSSTIFGIAYVIIAIFLAYKTVPLMRGSQEQLPNEGPLNEQLPVNLGPESRQ